MAHAPKRWLITGVSNGLGRALAEAALQRGHTVAGLVRRPEARAAFEALCPGRATGFLADVTDHAAARRAVAEAQAAGGIDVLVNNAGQLLETTVEEASEPAIQSLFAVNVHAPLNLIQAVLPAMRARGAGHIINISSAGGMTGLAALGIYCATKFALEGLSEALAAEIGPFGIKVTLVEPGSFRTNLLVGGTTRIVTNIPAYQESCGAWRSTLAGIAGHEPNDPARFARAVLAAAEAANPPFRLPLGRDAYAMLDSKLARVRADIEPGRQSGSDMAFTNATWYALPPGQSQTS